MKLYHFTALDRFPAIEAKGLERGDVPFPPAMDTNAVWLTSDPDPEGQGVAAGELIPQVRVTVVIASTDRRLKPWLPWARRHLAPDYRDRAMVTLASNGLRKFRSWYLYVDAIPPSAFAALELIGLRDDVPLVDQLMPAEAGFAAGTPEETVHLLRGLFEQEFTRTPDGRFEARPGAMERVQAALAGTA